jgi:prepilin-type N-terminal cleavage/methylation domain-containing protein
MLNPNSMPSVRSIQRRGALALRRAKSRAFTLLETMMALIVIGVGVLAFVDAQTSFVRSNSWSSQASTAMLLGNEIREMVRRLPRHDPVTGLYFDAANALVGWGRETGEVTADDIDDIDDLDGIRFGTGGQMAGPIDASGAVIPAITMDGIIRLDANGVPVPLEGWSQRVIVEKVDPYNFNLVRTPSYVQAASANLGGIAVDQFPLRITVIVEFQGVNDVTPQEVTRLTWVLPR